MASTATRIGIRITEDNEEERFASPATIKPGHILELLSTNKVQQQSTYGAKPMPWVALEDGLRGWPRSEFDAYAANDVVPIHAWEPGELVTLRLPANAPAVVVGNQLTCNGDGCVVKTLRAGGNELYNPIAASTGVTNTVSTEQFFDTTYSVPANLLQAGDILHVRGSGVVSASAGTDTLTVKLYLGAITIVTTAAVDSATGDQVFIDAYIRIRTVGASGTFVADVLHTNGVPGTATLKSYALASSALDTTVANIVRASATWSATTATCTVALQGFSIELIRTNSQSVVAIATEAIDNSATAAEALIICLML